MGQVDVSGNTIFLSGPVTFETVADIEGIVKTVMPKMLGSVCVDMSKVGTINSAALAMCIEIKRLAQDKSVQFKNMPEQLRSMINVYRVSGLIN